MKNYKQPGKCIPVTAGGAITSGSIQTVGSLLGVAATSAASGEQYELCLEGVFLLAKSSQAGSSGWAQGAPLYVVSGAITKDANSGANKFIGHAAKAAADADTTCEVILARGIFA